MATCGLRIDRAGAVGAGVCAAACGAGPWWLAVPAAAVLLLYLPGRSVLRHLGVLLSPAERTWWAIALSMVLMPVGLSWLWHVTNDRWAVLGGVAGVNVLLAAWPRRRQELAAAEAMFARRWVRWAFAGVAAWTVLCVFGAFWIPRAGGRVATQAAHDFVKHHAVLFSLERQPLPLHNVFCAVEAEGPYYYYEHHYLLAAGLRKLAADAISIPAGFGLTSGVLAGTFVALVYLIARRLSGSDRAGLLAAACVSVVGGWDAIPNVIRVLGGGSMVVTLDAWCPVLWRVHNFATQFLWCPQHVAAVLGLLTACLLLGAAPRARWWLIVAPLIAASIFGSSVYLAITIFAAAGVYAAWQVLRAYRPRPKGDGGPDGVNCGLRALLCEAPTQGEADVADFRVPVRHRDCGFPDDGDTAGDPPPGRPASQEAHGRASRPWHEGFFPIGNHPVPPPPRLPSRRVGTAKPGHPPTPTSPSPCSSPAWSTGPERAWRLARALLIIAAIGAALMATQAWGYYRMSQRYEEGLTTSWPRFDYALVGRLLPPGPAANFLDVPWIVLLDFGLPAVALVMVGRRVWASALRDEGARLLLLAAAVGLVAMFTVRSNVNRIDYGFRVSIMPTMVFAALCAGFLVRDDGVRRFARRLRWPVLAGGVLLGLPVGLYEMPATAGRTLLRAGPYQAEAGAIRWLRDRSPYDAVVQADPRRVSLAQLVDRQMGVVDPDNPHVRVFMPADPTRMGQALADVEEAFRADTAERAWRLLRRWEITHVLVGPAEHERFGKLKHLVEECWFTVRYMDGDAAVYALGGSKTPGGAP